jgi:hypothetical protein
MKKWPSFQQCWHLPARKSSQISAFGRLSLLKPLERALMPPWSRNWRSSSFSKATWFFSHETGMKKWPSFQ